MYERNAAYGGKSASLSEERRNAMILENISLVKSVVKRIADNLPPNVMIDDLMQIGCIGLIDAANRFEGDNPGEFRAYASYRIRGQIMDELRKNDVLKRAVRDKVDMLNRAIHELQGNLMRDPLPDEVAKHLGVSTDDYHALVQQARAEALISIEELVGQATGLKSMIQQSLGNNVQDPETDVQIEEIRHILVDEIEGLPERYRMVIALYYYDELTLKEIGEVLGVTESRVSQMHSHAVIRLEQRLRRSLGKDW